MSKNEKNFEAIVEFICDNLWGIFCFTAATFLISLTIYMNVLMFAHIKWIITHEGENPNQVWVQMNELQDNDEE